MRAFFKTPIGRIVLSFLKAFGATLVVLIPGILAAPDFGAAKATAIAAVIASVDAGFKALQIAFEKS